MISNYPEENVKLIRQFLLGKGLNEYAVAGLLGNLYSESRLRSNNLQNSCETKLGLTDEEYTLAVDADLYQLFTTDRAGYGLCQWTSSGRKAALYEYVKSVGASIGDLQSQLEYLWTELNGAYKKSVLSVLQPCKSVREAAEVVVCKFEIPASVIAGGTAKENVINVRTGYAQEFYDLYATKEVGKMKIAIDAGHGLYTSGKRVTLKGYSDTREWSLNSRIADKLQALLKSYNCEVIRVDDPTGATDIELSKRVSNANNWGADVYISIHHNAGVNGGSGGGTVVYYYSSKAERKTQAEAFYNAVVAQTKLVGNRSEKVKKYGYYVIKNTKMPAFLIENGFMDSTTDVPVILSDDHADKTAKGILNWLVSTWGLKASQTEAESNRVYKVQVGAFRSRANAETLLEQLKAKGFEGVIV